MEILLMINPGCLLLGGGRRAGILLTSGRSACLQIGSTRDRDRWWKPAARLCMQLVVREAEPVPVIRNNDEVVAEAWAGFKRMAVLGLLSMSALQTGLAAFVIGGLGRGENDKIIASGLLLFAGAAVAVALGFRKLPSPRWQHWLAVVVLAIPGSLALFHR